MRVLSLNQESRSGQEPGFWEISELENTVIGANSVVIKDIAANSVAVGSPRRRSKRNQMKPSLLDYFSKKKCLNAARGCLK